MTDYKKLVEALRHCVSDEKGVTKCAGCPYYPDITGCMDRLHTDAADAIEDLQAEQKKTVTQIFGEEQQKWEEYCTGLMNRIRELKSQLPKRGEWVPIQIGKWRGHKCSCCGIAREVPCSSSDGIPQWKYCPECGAKMEVQDADN